MNTVLIVDDDDGARFTMREFLRKNGFSTIEASGGAEGMELFERERPVAVLLDLKMPGMNGVETLSELKKIDPSIPVIIITAYSDIPSAVETTKLGAYDYLLKPPDFDRLIITIRRAVEKQDLEKNVRLLNTEVESSLEWMVGKSTTIRKIIKQIHQVARCNFSVIIQGETGTGKSTIAGLIHNLSFRRDKPFVCVDMGAIPETLVESELFGHEKGAFTGAERRKQGHFETALGGTILIDELQNLPLTVQGKLLRAVDEKKVHPLGGTQSVDINVRFIGATNTDIKEAVREKKFREDLFFRLGEVMISVPPLRERSEDIPYFAQRFLVEACSELNKPAPEIASDTLALLMRHSWPGNVRELKNVMRRAALFTEDDVLLPGHIDLFISHSDRPDSQPMPSLSQLPFVTMKDAEKAAIRQAMQITGDNKSKAALLLQIDYKTLLKKIKEYAI
jgi:DNA-binding NtrC family response regulator